MKKLLLILFFILTTKTIVGQSTCANAPLINDGDCLTNQTFPGSVNMAGLCVGGGNPALYLKFVAGSCSEFTIKSSSNISVIGSQILTTSCSGVVGTLECHENVVANIPFSANGINSTGGNLLTSGTTYVLRLWGPVVAGTTFTICYKSNQSINTSDECGGALSVGTTPISFYNGGDCQFTGVYTNVNSGDPTPSALCAGSLENTQWIKFTPQSGVTTFTILGSNIQCIGGGCGFQFGIFSGSCSSLLSEGCYGNKVCSGGQSVQGPINQNANDGYSLTWSNTTSTSFQVVITRTGGLSFTGSEVFYLVMDGNADADCTFTLQGINLTPLPIELIEFNGKNYGEYNLLTWITATELNNDYFILETSLDGHNWSSISIQDGNGTINTPTMYGYKDYGYSENVINYYRLSQTDYNGQRKYFNIVAVEPTKTIKCENYEYFNLMGIKIEFEKSPPGLYLRKCGDKIDKILKIF